MNLKKYILDEIEDLVTKFVYYDRKDDEELSKDDLRKAILEDKEITVDEIVAAFKICLLKEFPVRKIK